MRLTLDPPMARLLRSLPRSFPYTVIEIVLLALLAIQCARIVWTVAAPIGPFGAWRTAEGASLSVDSGLLTRFDPFFRFSGTGQTVVTSLSLKLYGVRVDQAMGRGSAIIATPDGVQNSYAIGDEILPGVRLKSVATDSVTIDRGGTPEQLYLDQSVAASVASPSTASSPVIGLDPGQRLPPPPSLAPAITAQTLAAGIALTPRRGPGGVKGFEVNPRGDGKVFATIGLQPGDVVTTINGRTLRSSDDLEGALGSLGSGGVSFAVERGGKIVTLSARGGQ